MPGWNPLNMWNPTDYHDDPDCRLAPMYNEVMIGALKYLIRGKKRNITSVLYIFVP